VLVLQAQKKHPAYRGPETHINVTPLHVGVQDDGSFLKLRSMNDEEIRECFGIAPLYLGSANDLNRASAAVARIVTNEQEFIPMILSEEHVINATIMKGLGAKYSVFRFRRPKTTDALQDAQVLAKLNAHMALSINQIISLVNRLIPGSDIPIRKEPWANIPIKILELNKQGNVDNNIDNEVKNILMDIKDKINDTYDIDNPM
jgi:capsid portal protein